MGKTFILLSLEQSRPPHGDDIPSTQNTLYRKVKIVRNRETLCITVRTVEGATTFSHSWSSSFRCDWVLVVIMMKYLVISAKIILVVLLGITEGYNVKSGPLLTKRREYI